MDNLKVNEWQRKKYNLLFWIKERFYERSVGHALREGQLPSSIRDNDILLKDGNALTRLLPYECFDSGFFQNQDTIGAIYKVDPRMDGQQLADLMHLLAGAGFLVQLTSLVSAYGSHLLISVGAEHASANALKEAVRTYMSNDIRWSQSLEPQQFLSMLRPFFQGDVRAVDTYDDQVLINNQFGDVEGELNFERLTLGGRDIRFYVVSRWEYGGWHLINHIPQVLPAGHFAIVTHSLTRKPESDKYLLATTLLTSLPKGAACGCQLEALFASKGWILEREIAFQPLVMMSTLPLGMNRAARDILLKRRFITAVSELVEKALFLRCV